ncbi:hypothetical protein F5B20DRAFT_586769 [Whalleya microplaca]|nr:hypothetical protein F5B20DRAFT_586769 [Whalleya microplaca]
MFAPRFRGLFTRLSTASPCSCKSSAPTISNTTFRHIAPATSISSHFLVPGFSSSMHTTAPKQYAVPAKGGKSASKKSKRTPKKGKADLPDPRIVNLKSSMPRRVPAPLRFARNRYLRHWTIHRAWQLHLRKERIREEHELERMYQGMHNACEELRKTSGPGTRDEGYLYRLAMEKKGVYGHNGVPIEYARPQTETPAREPWNHGWTRL